MGLRLSKKPNHEIVVASPDSSPKLTYKQPRIRHPFPPSFPPPELIQSSQAASLLGKPYVNINQMYEMKKELGRGNFGVTYLCVDKVTRQEYACKSIPKGKLLNIQESGDVRREVMILQHLSGQHNIVEFKGAYEDRQNVHLVMELCSGGELFHHIVAKGRYTEREAVIVMRQIVNVIHVCHFMGVMHRDIKPENLLFATKDENATLKLVDFGFSVFIEEGKLYKDIVGNAYYAAPEVLKRCYGKEIDVWNAGVILYILLSGVPPFWVGMVDAISGGKLDMDSEPWPSISDAAKDLTRKMLTYDPKKRITTSEAFEHPWMKEGADAFENPPDGVVLIRMKRFKAMNQMKKLALKVIAENLSEEEIIGMRQMFKNLDTDRSGTITFEELKAGLSRLGSHISDSELRQLMDAADVDKNGSLDYCELITATMDQHKLEREGNLLKAFQYFDKDNSGYITRDGLRQGITDQQIEVSIDEAFDCVDSDKDGRIDYHGFATMMRNGC